MLFADYLYSATLPAAPGQHDGENLLCLGFGTWIYIPWTYPAMGIPTAELYGGSDMHCIFCNYVHTYQCPGASELLRGLV